MRTKRWLKEAVLMNSFEYDEKSIIEKLNTYGIKTHSVPYFAQCDLSDTNSYSKSLICATDDRLCVFKADGGFFSQEYSSIQCETEACR